MYDIIILQTSCAADSNLVALSVAWLGATWEMKWMQIRIPSVGNVAEHLSDWYGPWSNGSHWQATVRPILRPRHILRTAKLGSKWRSPTSTPPRNVRPTTVTKYKLLESNIQFTCLQSDWKTYSRWVPHGYTTGWWWPHWFKLVVDFTTHLKPRYRYRLKWTSIQFEVLAYWLGCSWFSITIYNQMNTCFHSKNPNSFEHLSTTGIPVGSIWQKISSESN